MKREMRERNDSHIVTCEAEREIIYFQETPGISRSKNRIDPHALFSFFTAEIIKRKDIFIR